MKSQMPIIEGLFTWPSDDPHLIAGRCKTCHTIFFPKFCQQHKPDCHPKIVEEIQLSKRGKLASFTILHIPPPPLFKIPPSQVPYAVGVIELPEGLKVVGLLTGCKWEDLKMYMDVEIVIEKLYENEEGIEALTWKLKPT